MRRIDPADTPTPELFGYLLGGIGPRPIALVSTVDGDGRVNLSPFSWFNVFGANPPMLAFSPSRRVRDNTTKHTFENLKVVPECVVQAVTYPIVQQVSLASTEYGVGVDEFVKSGLTPIASDVIAPPRVAESPFHLECRVDRIIELGGQAGSGNLVLCEIKMIHIAEDIFGDGRIDPDKIDLVARMGGDFYCRASGDAVFEVAKPIATRGIGYDQLPSSWRTSTILSANNLGQLANTEAPPSADDVERLIDAARSAAETHEARAAFERMESVGDFCGMLAAALVLEREPGARARFERVMAVALLTDEVSFAFAVGVYADQSLA